MSEKANKEKKDNEKEVVDNETINHETEPAGETAEKEKENVEEEPKEDTPTTEQQLEAAKREIESLNDKLLRKIAEFDNYRKRTMKEKTELILNGGEKTIVALLPVVDDLERALKNMKVAEDVTAVAEGVELIYKKFLEILKKQGVEPIDTRNADFNVDLHEAIAQLPAQSDEMKGKIMDCTLTGYKMNEKVIRHSQVVVGL